MIMLRTEGLGKSFTLHLQGGVTIPVLENVEMTVSAGECVALAGPSGAGKSTLMRCLYGNYGAEHGRILLRHQGREVDLTTADARLMREVRRDTLGYVSQFLRVIPRVATRDIVAEPLMLRGTPREAPATRAGEEQRRLNLPDALAGLHPVLLLDEPTASLDAANAEVVIELIQEAKAAGSALVGIFHDLHVRDRIADRLFTVEPIRKAA